MRKMFQYVVALLALCLASAATAATYTLPAGIGSGPFASCALSSGTTYNCTASLSFANNDVINVTSPLTLRLTTGSFTAGNNFTINSNGNSFTINVVTQSINIGNNFSGTVNFQSGQTVDIGNNAVITGNITATTLNLGNNTTVAGSCTPTNAKCTNPVASCVVDNFSSGTLDTNLWGPLALGGSFTPQIVTVGSQKRLRLTDTGTNESTLLQLKKWFPAAGNTVVAEIQYHVYGGSGADGLGVVFSDASIAPQPGGYGGSLGYAQRNGANGFAGGWLGVGVDEFGNFSGTGEGRGGYPTGWTAPVGANSAAAVYKNNVSVRGSGSATTGYKLLATTGVLSPVIWQNTNTSASVQRYRITIDNANGSNVYLKVERDTTGSGTSYTTIVPQFDLKAANSGQATIPTNLLLSFTASTGGSTNYHELSLVNICATTINPPGSSTNASAFEALDTGTNSTWSTSARKPLYTKLANTAFQIDVAALKSDGTLESNYIAAGGSSKYVLLELFDDTTPAANCAAYSNPVATKVVTFASGSYSGTAGRTLSGNITVANAYQKLRARLRECTSSACTGFTAVAAACSSDQFSVRPTFTALTTSATATPPSRSASPAFATGANFTLRATTNANYSGTLTQDSSKITAQTPTQDSSQATGGAVGSLTPASLVGNAAAVSATYSEVGYAYLGPGAYRDSTFTAVDRAVGDCVTSTTANANLSDTVSGGKYGCDIGNKTAVTLGRFYPTRFDVAPVSVTAACTAATPFTYFGQDGFTTAFTVTAKNAAGTATANYSGVFAKMDLTNYSSFGFSAATLPAGASLSSGATAPTGTWTSGVATVSATHQISRPSALTAATSIVVSAVPADGEVAASAAAAVSAATSLRFGRLAMKNVYGSEKLAAAVPLEAQYWQGSYFTRNTDDSCTAPSVPASTTLLAAPASPSAPAGAPGLYFYPVSASNALLSSDTSASLSAATLSSGVANLNLSAPASGHIGWLDLIIAAPAHLRGDWGNCMGQTGTAGLLDDYPCARATFGKYRSPLIYSRENY